MASLTLYIPGPPEAANTLRAKLNEVFGLLGYGSVRSNPPYRGAAAEGLQVLAEGEVALVLLPPEHQAQAIQWLREQAAQIRQEANDFTVLGLAEALDVIAAALDAAMERMHAS